MSGSLRQLAAARERATRRQGPSLAPRDRDRDDLRRKRIVDFLGWAATRGVDDLRDHTLLGLRDLVVEVDVVEALFDSRQLTQAGVLTAEAADAMTRQHAEDAAAQAERLALGEPLGHGATASPGSVAALSVHDTIRRQLGIHVDDATYHLASALPPSAVSIVGPLRVHRRADRHRPTVLQLAAHLERQLRIADDAALLARVATDVEIGLDATHRVVDGPQKVWAGRDATCPDCKLASLYLLRNEEGEWVARCLRPPRAHHYAPCVCADPFCACKTNPVTFRHTWRDQGGHASLTSWTSLKTRLGIQKASHDYTATERTPGGER